MSQPQKSTSGPPSPAQFQNVAQLGNGSPSLGCYSISPTGGATEIRMLPEDGRRTGAAHRRPSGRGAVRLPKRGRVHPPPLPDAASALLSATHSSDIVLLSWARRLVGGLGCRRRWLVYRRTPREDLVGRLVAGPTGRSFSRWAA